MKQLALTALVPLATFIASITQPTFANPIALETSNLSDRTFVTSGTTNRLVERRWTNNGWQWVHHPALNNGLANAGNLAVYSVGPLLCDQGFCKLYSVTTQGVYSYVFEQNQSSPGSNATVSTPWGVQPRFELTGIKCNSNIVFDSNWHLHCQALGLGTDTGFHKYDLEGNLLATEEISANGTPTASALANSVHIFDGDKVAYNFYSSVYIAHALNPTNATSDHSGSRNRISAIGGDESSVIAIRRDIFGRQRMFTISGSGGNYSWDRVSTPNYARRVLDYTAIAQIGDGKWAAVGENTRNGSHTVVERYERSNDWAWADHGWPAAGQPFRVFDSNPNDSQFFVTTTNNRLVLRNWEGTRWAWSDHGVIPN